MVAPNAHYTAALRWFDYSIVAYMDDLLFVLCISPHRTQQVIMLLRSIFSAFGIAVSADKSVLELVTTCEFFGVRCSRGWHFGPHS